MDNVRPSFNVERQEDYFDPMSYDGKTLKCCCGYELIKEDNDVWRCTGGSHRYRVEEGEVEYDKFGNILFKTPANFGGTNNASG